MENQNEMSFIKQLSLSVITLALGSFIFVGVLENYKSDESIKFKQLEEYFKPAREAANLCLKKQNELFLHYPNYGGTLKLMFGELSHLIDNPELDGNYQYGLLLEGYTKNMLDAQKKQKELPPIVDACRQEVFLKLESLSIATGTFEYFSELAKRRSARLNVIDQQFRDKLKKSNKGMDEDELIDMMRQFGTMNPHSKDEMKALILDFGSKLPMIEAYSIYLAETEQDKYNVESEFFGEIRDKSADNINSRFKQGFFSWLLR
jgi:hypothetical protein